MRITIVYDNEAKKAALRSGWGFSAYIESQDIRPLLFDTGADSPTLLHNMKILNMDPTSIETIVISHAHRDHTGGLSEILHINESAQLFLPQSLRAAFPGRRVTVVEDAMEICTNIFSTGELEAIEQSLAIKTDTGIFVVTGCAHPAMNNILGAASKFGTVYGIAGGFHGFRDFKLFDSLSLIYPCHCTQYKTQILDSLPGKASECGAGLVIQLSRRITDGSQRPGALFLHEEQGIT
jgi:7,8-dihydropterin-6-yl-methyl-4-(beta-D-ribofuranosyl)aminobenzene 5'-phosphate synthase